MDEFKKTVSPLNILGINFFLHLRIFPNKKFFILTSSKDVEEYFKQQTPLSEFFSNILLDTFPKKLNISFWPFLKNDRFLQRLNEIKIGNGLRISYRLSRYTDIFLFAGSMNNPMLPQGYLNYLKALKQFIIFYRLKLKKKLSALEFQSKKTNTPLKFSKIIPHRPKQLEALKQFVCEEKLNHKSLHLLSRREKACLILTLEGLSMRNIAHQLSLSPRTVESYLNSVKAKVGANSKEELFSYFLNQEAL